MHILSHIRFTLMTLHLKRNRLFVSRPFLVTEYRTTLKFLCKLLSHTNTDRDVLAPAHVSLPGTNSDCSALAHANLQGKHRRWHFSACAPQPPSRDHDHAPEHFNLPGEHSNCLALAREPPK